jgi:hypothetical protein
VTAHVGAYAAIAGEAVCEFPSYRPFGDLMHVIRDYEPGKDFDLEASRHKSKENLDERPHGSLGYQTPAEFAAGCAATSAPARPPLQPRHSRIPEKETTTVTQPVIS